MLSTRSEFTAGAFLMIVLAVSATSVSGQNPAAPPAVPPAKAETAPKVDPPKAAPRPRRRAVVPLDSFKLPQPGNIGNARTAVSDMRDGKRLVLDPSTKKVARENVDALNIMAKSFVYVLTDKVYYIQPEPVRNELKPTPPELTLQSRFDEAERFILVPTWGRKLTIDQADYIVAFGEAMDAAILDILQPKPAKAGDPPPPVPEIMQINAARMLAMAARSGAPAHYPTILNLLKNPDTDPAILIYAIKAAEGLIAAFNPVFVNDIKYPLHTIKDAEMVKLVEALDVLVKRTKPYGYQPPPSNLPPAPLPPPPGAKTGDVKVPPPPVTGQLETQMVNKDEQMVIRYFRRAALRALAQCRYPQFMDAQDGRTVRPLVTLAKIAVGDPSITSTPGSDELAIAVIGLCNLHDYKDVNVDALCDVVAQGVWNFTTKKQGNPKDKSIPWKVTGSYLISAFADWQKVPSAARFRKIESLATVAVDRVLVPMEKMEAAGGNPPSFDALARWREQNAVPELKLFLEAKEPAVKPGYVGGT